MGLKASATGRPASVTVRVGDQSYPLRSNVDDGELRRLAALVDAKIREIVPAGRPIPPSAIVLAAIALAHDLEEERALSSAASLAARQRVAALLARVDDALDRDCTPELVASGSSVLRERQRE